MKFFACFKRECEEKLVRARLKSPVGEITVLDAKDWDTQYSGSNKTGKQKRSYSVDKKEQPLKSILVGSRNYWKNFDANHREEENSTPCDVLGFKDAETFKNYFMRKAP